MRSLVTGGAGSTLFKSDVRTVATMVDAFNTAASELGWRARTPLQDGLAQTLAAL